MLSDFSTDTSSTTPAFSEKMAILIHSPVIFGSFIRYKIKYFRITKRVQNVAAARSYPIALAGDQFAWEDLF